MHRLIWAVAAILLLTAAAFAQTEREVVKPPVGLTVEPGLCTGLEDRNPVGESDAFPADVDRVYLWTKVTGVTEGEVIIHHVWLREGQEMADVALPVKGSPWRTYSFKTIPPEWAGNWEVKITGPDGNVLTSVSFSVGAKVEEEKPAEPTTEGL